MGENISALDLAYRRKKRRCRFVHTMPKLKVCLHHACLKRIFIHNFLIDWFGMSLLLYWFLIRFVYIFVCVMWMCTACNSWDYNQNLIKIFFLYFLDAKLYIYSICLVFPVSLAQGLECIYLLAVDWWVSQIKASNLRQALGRD